MGILARIFGTEKAITETSKTVNNVFDGVSAGIDAAFYTDEEKARASKELFELRLQAIAQVQKFLSPGESLTRRIIALIALVYYFGFSTAAGVLLCFGKTETASGLFQLIRIEPPSHILAIFILYFGYYGVKRGIETYQEGKKK